VGTIDWTAFGTWGTWVQTVFVAGGTIFAVMQYLKYQANERTKRTLELLVAYDNDRLLGTSGKEITPAQALPLIRTAVKSIDNFRAGCADYNEGRQTPSSQQFLLWSDGLTFILNYFNHAGSLAKRNLIDKGLFLEAQSYLMTLMFDPVRQLLEAEDRPYDLTELEQFVEDARVFVEAHPVLQDKKRPSAADHPSTKNATP
jgi:hypothetical protein